MELLYPDYRSTRLRARGASTSSSRASHGADRPGAVGRPRRRARPRPHPPARRGAARGADHRRRPVLEHDGRPVPDTLVEVWQCNAAGRYRHQGDRPPAPLDQNFTGLGRCLTGADGSFEFVTIKPGAYPWGNHHNAWRPAHIHFSVFGRAFA